MKFTSLLFAFVIGLIGCAAGNAPVPASCPVPEHPSPEKWPKVVRTLYLDPVFGPDEVSAIMAGAMAWTQATRGIVEWRIRYGADDEVFTYEGPPCSDSLVMIKAYGVLDIIKQLDSIHGKESSNMALAYTRSSCDLNVTLMVVDRIADDEFFSVATHEIGHFLGIKHIEKPGAAIMNPVIDDAAPCITKVDLQAFCEKYKCDYTALNACDYEPKKPAAPAAPDASVGD